MPWMPAIVGLVWTLASPAAHANPVPMFGQTTPAVAIGGPSTLIVAVPPNALLIQRPVLPNGGIRSDARLPNTWDVPPGPKPWLEPRTLRPTAWQSKPTRVGSPGAPVQVEALGSVLQPVESLQPVQNHLPE